MIGVGYLIALSLFTVGVVIIALCILLNNIYSSGAWGMSLDKTDPLSPDP